MTACSCHFDAPDVYHAARPLARNTYRCTECGQVIHPGERYERVAVLWERRWSHYKMCVHCLAVRDACELCGCFCWEHGNLLQNICDHLDWVDFLPGQRFSLLRLIAVHPWRQRQ